MALLRCDKCQTPLTGAVVNSGVPVACHGCGVEMLADVFPALARPVARGQFSEAIASDEDASCFYHPGKKAVVPCGQCGRFLCALCDLQIDAAHVCPPCVELDRQSGRTLAAPRRTLHDRIALFLCVIGLGPIAVFLVLRYWNEPARSPVPRGRGTLIVAGVLGLGETAGWIALIIYLARFK